MSEERGRLSRWAERKAAARRGEILPEPAEETPPPPAQSASLEPDVAPDAEAAPADDEMPVLPPIEELTAESDYTVFLNPKVSETVRRAALRKLWRSDPVLANLDGLNDYDEDYNVVDTIITSAQTAYRVGRGYVDEIEEKLEQVERVLGDDARDESPMLSDKGEGPDAGEAVSESDAAGDNPPDAPRQIADATPIADPAHPREDSGA